MTDDQNQDLYEAMRSDLETGECALLDDSRSGPTVVRLWDDLYNRPNPRIQWPQGAETFKELFYHVLNQLR